jgi:hypothetical protein
LVLIEWKVMKMATAPKDRTAFRPPGLRAGDVNFAHGATHTPIDVLVGERLRELRNARSMALTDVSSAIDVPACQIARYESGESRVTPGDLIEFAELYGVGLQALFPGKREASATQMH